MPPTYPIITVKWVGLESLSSEELLQRFTDKQRKRICSKRVLGLDACGNPLKSLEGLEAYSQLVSLSMARCQLTSLGCTLLSSSLRHLDVSGNTLETLQGVEQLYNLTWLDASHNALQSAAEVTCCSQLQVLGLANNHLTSLDGLEGSLSLQSLRVEGNNIKQDLDIRTLAVLPNLRHLGLAGNPVMADMDFSQQRAFLVDLMPGLLTLDNQAVSSSVSAHLYSVRESKLGRTHPHQFNEQLLFGSSDETETPVVKVEAAPTSAVHLAAKQHQLQQQHALLQSAPSTQLHLSQQLPEQLWQQLQQQQAQQLSVQRPTSAPQMKGPHIAFGHKADWDFSTGSKRVDGRLDGQAKGKSARLNGQNLALLENSDWAHLRNEVPVNRHVTVEHACQLAHHGSASLPFGNTSEKQNTPLKSRPDSAALNFSSSPSPKAPGTLIGKAGMQVLDGTSSSPQPPKTLSFGTQLPVGSAASSPRSLSPNSYLARSGMSKTLPNSGAGIGSPKSTQPRSSSPLSRPGKPQTLANPSSGQPCSSSPLSRPATAGHLLEQSQGQKAPPGRAARSRGRTSSSAWRAAQEEMQKLDPAKPSFMQTLRTRSLSPEYWHAKSKGTAVAWPTWQQYERHVTPDRALARPACIRRVFQGIARTTPGIHDQQGRAFCSELAEAGPSGIDHVPNQAPTVSSKPVNKKSSAKRLQSSVQSPGTSSAVKAWSPAGKAPSTARAAPGKLLSPAAKGQSLGLQPFSPSASASLAGHTQLNGSSGARASPAQPQPIRAGQQAIAALLAKQAAWEVTRTSSLPPVLSEITALLRCNSKSFLTPPARTATELAVAADPQLRQAAWESATAVVVDGSERQQVPSLEAAAVAATASQADAAQELPDGAKQGIAASSTAEDAVSSQMQAPVPVPKPSLSSRSLKSELRVSFAKQIQIDIEAEGQHAQRGSKTPGGNYFLGAGYFQEADNVMAAEQHAASERQESGIEDAEKRLEAEEQGEEADDETVAENLYDAEDCSSSAKPGQRSPSPSRASTDVCSTSTAFPPKAVTADLTAHNVRQFESSHMTFASAVPSPASLSPQSSSPLLAAASSATSLAPRSSTPLEGSHLGSQFVAILQGELQQHQEAFNDDLAFIQEVQTRQTLAAGMHPNQELLSLHKRFNNWKFDFKVRMRDIEKTMRQMERDEYRHARGLTSPTGRTDSGRTTPMGRGTLPGITPSASGFTTPSGRVTPPGVTSEVAAFGRVTPPSTSVSGRTTPTGKVTPPGTSPSGRATPTDRSANPTANAGNPQGFATADAAVIASTIDRGLSSAFLHESSSAPDASTNTLVSGVANETADVFGQQQAYSSGLSMNGSATAVGLEHAIIDISSGSLATAVPGQLVSARSSVKEAIAMYEGSHPVSTRLSNSQYTAAQQSSSPSEGAYSKLTSSQSSVAYQTKSLSEGVYGKLYSSKSSVSQIATSPSWDQGEEEELISSSIPAAGSRHIAGSGFSTASGGGGRGADATSSSEISRFGGGIGRGGMNKYAVEVKPADWDAANQEAELDPSSERLEFGRRVLSASERIRSSRAGLPPGWFAWRGFEAAVAAKLALCGVHSRHQQTGFATTAGMPFGRGRRIIRISARTDNTPESDAGTAQEATSPVPQMPETPETIWPLDARRQCYSLRRDSQKWPGMHSETQDLMPGLLAGMIIRMSVWQE
ncbi:hypothetical protein WJX77_009755 [Trebouxia sp. C0004]